MNICWIQIVLLSTPVRTTKIKPTLTVLSTKCDHGFLLKNISFKQQFARGLFRTSVFIGLKRCSTHSFKLCRIFRYVLFVFRTNSFWLLCLWINTSNRRKQKLNVKMSVFRRFSKRNNSVVTIQLFLKSNCDKQLDLSKFQLQQNCGVAEADLLRRLTLGFNELNFKTSKQNK